MSATTYTSSLSAMRSVPGFSGRLDEVLAQAGFRSYGRQQVVREFSGLTQSGVKKMYAEDRPPRSCALNQLLSNLVTALSKRNGSTYSVQSLHDYLLLNQGGISAQSVPTPTTDALPASSCEFDISAYFTKDPVYTSKIILKIEDIGRAEGIDTVHGIAPEDMNLIRFRIISYCHKNLADIDAPKVCTLIFSLFELARQGDL